MVKPHRNKRFNRGMMASDSGSFSGFGKTKNAKEVIREATRKIDTFVNGMRDARIPMIVVGFVRVSKIANDANSAIFLRRTLYRGSSQIVLASMPAVIDPKRNGSIFFCYAALQTYGDGYRAFGAAPRLN